VREQRKVVTILFADVVGSTELAGQRDPEVVRAMMARYFMRIGEISAAYGGTVEKFAGDAAMVVFGVPAVHDDDAERAVRTALEIRDGASEVVVRVGVNTGEAVTAATDDRQFMVSGDAVNVAARLQQGAEPGEVVVGPMTYQLTRNVIEYGTHEPISAKGKAEPLAAHRAVRAKTDVPIQARGVPGLRAELVGRKRELRLLIDTFARAAEDLSPHLFTIVGSAGIGKSRLVDEALAAATSSGARVLRGRCLPYGRGITYWPLIEMLRQDTGITLGDDRTGALHKLDRWLGELFVTDPQRPAIRARLAVMLGLETAEAALSDTPAERVEREIAWAVRRYAEVIATSMPLITVIDDMQWAEPPIVSLLEQLAERVSDVPLMILCMARPEFLESHVGWGAGKPNSTTITLDPLTASETETLVSRLLEVEALPEEIRRQIVERSAGTPLFCEEFIHMLIDEGVVVQDGASWKATAPTHEIRVPEGINAVLAARLDLLNERERAVLQAASVIGQRFGLGQVDALAGGDRVETALESLRRKGLVAGGDGMDEEFFFRHILVRDVAYGSLPKAARAELHDRFRAVLERETADPNQIAEILAHHAERAFALSRELGLDEEVVQQRARHAVRWMFAMADRARTRHDVRTLEPALKALNEAAEALAGGGGIETRARLGLLEAQLLVVKGDYVKAREAAAEAASLAETANLVSTVATARLTEAWVANWAFDESQGSFEAIVDRAIEACRRAKDAAGEIEARHIGTMAFWAQGRLDEYAKVNQELVRQAESAGDTAHVAAIAARLVPCEFVRGNGEASRRWMALAEDLATKHGLRNVALRVQFDRAVQSMWRGELPLAEQLLHDYEAAAVDAGAGQHQMSALRFLGYTLLYAGRPLEAAVVLDKALELSEATGERWNRTEVLSMRARAALDAGDMDAADRFIERAMESLRPGDLTAVSEAHLGLGLVRAGQGRAAEAETALRRAVEAVAPTEFVNITVAAALSLAIFLAGRGRFEEAAAIADPYVKVPMSRDLYLWEPFAEEYRRLDKTRRLV
jgi:class 3 adenylate cyclase/tetratricopeptide (TPR) repeat protein